MHRTPRFYTWSRSDVEDYAKEHDVPSYNLAHVYAVVDIGNRQKVEELMNALHDKVRLRDAERAFVRAKNVEILEEIFFSDEVRGHMMTVRQCLDDYSVSFDRDEDERPDPNQLEKQKDTYKAINELFRIMRKELQRGDVP